MSRVLNDNVWVGGVLYPAGSTPPADVAEKIGDHAWVEVAGSCESAPVVEARDLTKTEGKVILVMDPTISDGPPPLHGKGSNMQAWSSYAQHNGFDVDEVWTRGDLISALAAAGIPTE